MTNEEHKALPYQIKISLAIRKINLSNCLGRGRVELPLGETVQLHNGYIPMSGGTIQLFLN